MITQGLSVRELESLVRRTRENGTAPVAAPAAQQLPLPESYDRLLGCVGKFFKKDISLRRNAAGSGTMTIRFSSDSEVEAFLKALEEARI